MTDPIPTRKDTTPGVFADDLEVAEQAHELAMRVDLIRQLAEHPGINRKLIEQHRAECNELVRTISSYLLTAVYE